MTMSTFRRDVLGDLHDVEVLVPGALSGACRCPKQLQLESRQGSAHGFNGNSLDLLTIRYSCC